MKDESTQPIAETITPLGTPRKKAGTDRDDFKRRYWLKGVIIAGAFLLLIIGGGWLLVFLSQKSPLPDKTANDPLPAETVKLEKPTEPVTKPPQAVDSARLELEKTTAEQKLAEYLEVKGELDNKAASQWGEESYLEMTALGRQADARFMEKQYVPAAELYSRAISLAGKLADRMGRTTITIASMALSGACALTAGFLFGNLEHAPLRLVEQVGGLAPFRVEGHIGDIRAC